MNGTKRRAIFTGSITLADPSQPGQHVIAGSRLALPASTCVLAAGPVRNARYCVQLDTTRRYVHLGGRPRPKRTPLRAVGHDATQGRAFWGPIAVETHVFACSRPTLRAATCILALVPARFADCARIISRIHWAISLEIQHPRGATGTARGPFTSKLGACV